MDRFLVPRLGFALVIGLATTLIWVIVLRSPNTHAHLWETLDPTYTRTPLAFVGQKAGDVDHPQALVRGRITTFLPPKVGFRGVEPTDPGRALYLREGCATCHGLDAQGGPVGPSLAASNPVIVESMVRQGRGGMPSYTKDQLSDADLAKLATYLQGLKIVGKSSEEVAAIQRLIYDPSVPKEELLKGKAALRRSCGACHSQPTKEEIRLVFGSDFDAASLVAQMAQQTTLSIEDAKAIARYMLAIRNGDGPVREP